VKRKEAEGQFDLFSDVFGESEGVSLTVDIPDVPDWDKKQRLAMEREMLGLYVSDHPLSGLEHVLAAAADMSIATLNGDEDRPDGSQVSVAGLVTSITRKMSKQGNPWAKVTIEDMEGEIDVLFFGETYLAYSSFLAEDAVLIVKGRLRRRDESAELQAIDVHVPDLSHANDAPLVLRMESHRCTSPFVERLADVLRTHPGTVEVHLRLTDPGRATVMKLDDTLRVERTSALFGDLKALLGPHCLLS
jgi:DNA polymerase-3 subunit alpha